MNLQARIHSLRSWEWRVSALATLLLAACSGDRDQNVVIITIDTLRADRLGCYGYEAAHTPHIDRLASEGVRVEQAYTVTPITLPAHSSLLTGAYPTRHGVRSNGSYRLGPELPTIAERLRGVGYQTAAFVSAVVLDRTFGLDRGFDVYDDAVEEGDERRGDRTAAAAVDWLEQRSNDPFFIWVHLFDPHQFYRPPPQYLTGDRSPYDGEIAFADACVGELASALEGLDLLDETLIVLLSDHGEGLLEHGERTHGHFIYDTTVRIPLILNGPSLPAGRVVSGLARIVDVMPTVLALLGRSIPQTCQGESLLPALRGEAGFPEAAYLETLMPRLSMGWSSLHGLRTLSFKLIEAPSVELYDVATDPSESSNLADQSQDRVEMMRRALRLETDGEDRDSSGSRVEAGPDLLSKLRGLGYLQSSSEPPPSGRDPKDLIEVLDLLSMVEDVLKRAQPKDMQRLSAKLDAALPRDPTNPQLLDSLGRVHAALGHCERARELLQIAADIVPRDIAIRLHLAEVLERCGDIEGAIAIYEHTRKLPVGGGPAGIRLGSLLLSLGREQEASDCLNAALEADGGSMYYLLEAAEIYLAAGRALKAEHLFRRALSVRPDDPRILERLLVACRAGRAFERVKVVELQLEEVRRRSRED